MDIFRFVDPATPSTIRLNLNNQSQWLVGQGLDLGGDEPTLKFLHQSPHVGSELASVDLATVTMTVPLILMPQATAADIETAVNALNTELARLNNCIEYRPTGITSGATWLIDTFRAPKISVHDGAQRPSQWMKKDGKLFVINIIRQPALRQRGTMI
jgi:hypothetical protein